MAHAKWTPTEPQRAEVRSLLRKWRDVMGWQDVRIEICYCTVDNEEETCAACTNADPTYRRMTICVHPKLWNGEMVHSRDWTLLHELLHYALNPYRRLMRQVLVKDKFVTWDQVHDIEEAIVSDLASVIHRVSGRDEAKERADDGKEVL